MFLLKIRSFSDNVSVLLRTIGN